MKHIANLLFEAKMLKEIPRSGFHFLGCGKESIIETIGGSTIMLTSNKEIIRNFSFLPNNFCV